MLTKVWESVSDRKKSVSPGWVLQSPGTYENGMDAVVPPQNADLIDLDWA